MVKQDSCRAKLVLGAYEAIRRNQRLAGHGNFIDISGALDGLAANIFTDDVHVAEQGNRHIARAMFPHVMKLLRPN
ncbi:MAG: hypothetical protein VB959_13885 [Rhodospirillales bacterium]